MNKYLGILGFPLSHSISPFIQQAALDHYSLSIQYKTWPTTSEYLESRINILRQEKFVGANVTIPHKESVMRCLDVIDGLAQRVGAVNTIVKDDGRLVGYNTDVHGFLTCLMNDVNFQVSGSSVLILGAGGAARAAAFGLVDQDVGSLVIANRSLGRAQSLVRQLSPDVLNIKSVSIEDDILNSIVPKVDLIVNATPVGMGKGPMAGISPIKSKFISSDTLVYDMTYNPVKTPLLIEASLVGAVTVGGLSMLVHQGAAGFELWTGRKAPIDLMKRAAENVMESSSSGALF